MLGRKEAGSARIHTLLVQFGSRGRRRVWENESDTQECVYMLNCKSAAGLEITARSNDVVAQQWLSNISRRFMVNKLEPFANARLISAASPC